MKDHTQNVVEKLVPDPFLKTQIWAYLSINSQKFYTICFYCMTSFCMIFEEKYLSCYILVTEKYYVKSKCPYLELFWSIFSLIWTEYGEIYLSVFSPNEGKYGPEELRIRTLFTQCKLHWLIAFTSWGIWKYMYHNCLLTRLWRHKFWS